LIAAVELMEAVTTRTDHIRPIELQIEALVGHIADLKQAELLQADDRPRNLLGRLSHKLAAKRGSLEAMQRREAFSIEVSRILARNKSASSRANLGTA
jgi:hypothetical protein